MTAATTITVRVRDRAAETLPSGSWTAPAIRSVTIPATCPTCGGPRGVPTAKREVEDGDWYTVDVWANPCGHVDAYTAVLAEARR